MKVIPRPQDNGFEAHQLTVENREFVVRWTGGIFHGDADPRQWRLALHAGSGLVRDAYLGNWIVRHLAGHFEVMTCDEFDRRYERIDRPGNAANLKPVSPVTQGG